MKKFYLFLALMLTILGIGVSRAVLIAIVDGDGVTEDILCDGMNVMIGQNISDGNGTKNADTGEYTHSFASNYKVIADNNDAEGYVGSKSSVSKAAATANQIWVLEAAKKDANGQWYNLKNAETGKYIGFNVNELREPMDPANPITLHDQGDGRVDEQWWRTNIAGEDEDPIYQANCAIELTLVEKADAKPFLFKSPEAGIALMGIEEVADDVMSLIQHLNDNDMYRLMIMTDITVKGKTYWLAMNSTGNGRLQRYHDWAAYWEVIEGIVEEQAKSDEFNNLYNSAVKSYPIGTAPGCVTEDCEAAAREYNEYLESLNGVGDEEHTDEEWQAYIDGLNAQLAKAESFTFRKIGAGYYRFVCSLQAYEQQQGVRKAMYSASNGNARWQNLDEGTEIIRIDTIKGEDFDPENPDTYELIEVPTGKYSGLDQIWQITEGEDGHLYVKNVATQLYFKNANTQSAVVGMSTTPKWVEFILLNTDYNLKVENKGYALHTAGHNNGAGESGNIVGWNNGSNTGSSWFLEPVDESYIIDTWGEEFTKAGLKAEFAKLMSEAQSTLDKAKTVDESYGELLVKDTDHITAEVGESGQDVANLIDGEPSTFWHSDWHTTAETAPHYVQFNIGKPLQNIVVYYVQRTGSTGGYAAWLKTFDVQISDSWDGEYTTVAEGLNILDVNIMKHGPASISLADYGMNPYEHYLKVDLTQPAQYIRVVCTANYNNGQFFSPAEMNIVDAATVKKGINFFEKANKQGNNVGTALEEIIAELSSEEAVIDEAALARLKAAYEAFLAVYTDSSELEALVAEAENQTNSVVPGNNPGNKPQNVWDALNNAQKDAANFVANNMETCTKAELDAKTAALKAALGQWYATPCVSFNANTWYYIQFTGERSSSSANRCYDNGTQLQHSRLSAMYGQNEELTEFGGASTSNAKVVIKAMYEDPTGYTHEYEVEGETQTFQNDYNAELSQWRFIALADGTYAVQNRGTGNFLPAIDLSNYTSVVALSPVPGSYSINDLNNGAFEFETYCGKNASGDSVKTYVNLYGNTNMGYWNVGGKSDIGSRWTIVAAEAVTDAPEIYIGFDGYKAKGITLPYGISCSENTKFYNKVHGIDVKNNAIGLNLAEGTIEAGTPFIAFSSDDEEITSNTTVKMEGSINLKAAVNNNILRGTLAKNDSINPGVAVATMDYNTDYVKNYLDKAYGSFKTIKARQHVAIGSAWLDIHEASDEVLAWTANLQEVDEILILNVNRSELVDEIQIVKGNKGEIKAIYNLNGQRVEKPVRGLYIINGKKVVVK